MVNHKWFKFCPKMLFWSSFSDPAVPDEGVKQERTYTFCTYLEQNLRSKGRQKTPHLRERITDEDKLSLMGDCETQRIHPWFPLRSKDTLQRGQAWICSLDSPNLSWSRTERRLSTCCRRESVCNASNLFTTCDLTVQITLLGINP